MVVFLAIPAATALWSGGATAAVWGAFHYADKRVEKTRECRAAVPESLLSLEDGVKGRKLCKIADAWESAMTSSSTFSDTKKLLKHASVLEPELVQGVLDTRPTDEKVMGLQLLLKMRAKVSKEMVLALVHAYSHEIGSEMLLELFEASKAFDLLFLYLESIVDASTEQIIHHAYLQAAVKTNRWEEAERMCRDSTIYDAAKIEDMLVRADLPSLRALVHVWSKQGKSVETITDYLFRAHRYEDLETYVSEIAPRDAPRVVDRLSELKCPTEIFLRVFNAAGAKSSTYDVEQHWVFDTAIMVVFGQAAVFAHRKLKFLRMDDTAESDAPTAEADALARAAQLENALTAATEFITFGQASAKRQVVTALSENEGLRSRVARLEGELAGASEDLAFARAAAQDQYAEVERELGERKRELESALKALGEAKEAGAVELARAKNALEEQAKKADDDFVRVQEDMMAYYGSTLDQVTEAKFKESARADEEAIRAADAAARAAKELSGAREELSGAREETAAARIETAVARVEAYGWREQAWELEAKLRSLDEGLEGVTEAPRAAHDASEVAMDKLRDELQDVLKNKEAEGKQAAHALAVKENQRAALLSRVGELERELLASGKKLDKAKEYQRSLAWDLGTATTKLMDLKYARYAESARAAEELSGAREELSGAREEAAAARAEATVARVEAYGWREQACGLEATLKSLGEELEGVTEAPRVAHDASEVVMDKLRDELQDVLKNKEGEGKQAAHALAVKEEERATLESRVGELERQLHASAEKLAEAREGLRGGTSEVERLARTVEEMEDRAEEEAEAREELEVKLGTATWYLKATREDVHAGVGKLEQTRRELVEARNEADRLAAENEERGRRVEVIQEQLEHMQEESRVRSAENQALRSAAGADAAARIDANAKEALQLAGELREAKEAAVKTAEAAEAMRTEMAGVQEDLRVGRAAWGAEMGRIYEQLDEIDRLKRLLESTQAAAATPAAASLARDTELESVRTSTSFNLAVERAAHDEYLAVFYENEGLRYRITGLESELASLKEFVAAVQAGARDQVAAVSKGEQAVDMLGAVESERVTASVNEPLASAQAADEGNVAALLEKEEAVDVLDTAGVAEATANGGGGGRVQETVGDNLNEYQEQGNAERKEATTGGGHDGKGGFLSSGGKESTEHTVASSRHQSHQSQTGALELQQARRVKAGAAPISGADVDGVPSSARGAATTQAKTTMSPG